MNNTEQYKFSIEGEILSPSGKEKVTKGRYDTSEDNDTEKEIKVNTLYKNEKSKRSYYTKKKHEDKKNIEDLEKMLKKKILKAKKAKKLKKLLKVKRVDAKKGKQTSNQK